MILMDIVVACDALDFSGHVEAPLDRALGVRNSRSNELVVFGRHDERKPLFRLGSGVGRAKVMPNTSNKLAWLGRELDVCGAVLARQIGIDFNVTVGICKSSLERSAGQTSNMVTRRDAGVGTEEELPNRDRVQRLGVGVIGLDNLVVAEHDERRLLLVESDNGADHVFDDRLCDIRVRKHKVLPEKFAAVVRKAPATLILMANAT